VLLDVVLFLLFLLDETMTNHTRGHIMPESCVEKDKKQQIGIGFIGWLEPRGLTSASGISCLFFPDYSARWIGSFSTALLSTPSRVLCKGGR
jgi:hypothetical protein